MADYQEYRRRILRKRWRRTFAVAGLLVLLIALSMLHGSASSQQAPTAKENKDRDATDSVAIYPLAIPLLLDRPVTVRQAAICRAS